MGQLPDGPNSTDFDEAAAVAPGHGALAADVDGPTPAAPGETAWSLLGFLRWASRSESLASVVASPSLSLNEVWLLEHVRRVGPLRLGDLAAWQRVDKSTVSSQVKSLLERGLLDRFGDPEDRRAVLVAVTPAGAAAATAAAERGEALIERVLAEWPAGDSAQLVGLLRRFVADAESRT